MGESPGVRAEARAGALTNQLTPDSLGPSRGIDQRVPEGDKSVQQNKLEPLPHVAKRVRKAEEILSSRECVA